MVEDRVTSISCAEDTFVSERPAGMIVRSESLLPPPESTGDILLFEAPSTRREVLPLSTPERENYEFTPSSIGDTLGKGVLEGLVWVGKSYAKQRYESFSAKAQLNPRPR